MTLSAITTTVAGLSRGMTTMRMRCAALAPSISHTSSNSSGMVVSPARKITIASPVCCHDQATITDHSAVSGFASHA